MIKKHFQLFRNTRPKSLIIIFFGSLLSAIFEMASIGSLPIFVGFISSPEIFVENTPNEKLKSFLLELTNFQLIFFSSIGVLIIFLIKNIFLSGLLFFENNTKILD